MNYNHLYHAGNFADIFKHYILILMLKRLSEKDAPFCVVDAFAGSGLYPLNSIQAQKTLEYKNGLVPFLDFNFKNNLLIEFQNFLQRNFENNFYYGSPLLAAHFIRQQDKIFLNELVKDVFDSLKFCTEQYKNISLQQKDAYAFMKAQVPPQLKRGVFLIDPPFETIHEFDLLIKNLNLWYKKFAQGHYAIWYPIKDSNKSGALISEARKISAHRSYRIEIFRKGNSIQNSFKGCGILLLNAPYMVVETLKETQKEIETALNCDIEIELLTTE